MYRKLFVVVGMILFVGSLRSDDKEPPVKMKGKVTEVDKVKGKITFTFKFKDKDDTKTLTVDEFLLTDSQGKKYEGKAILTALEAGDPIIIPRVEKEKDKIVIIKIKKE